jgi:hypothetical protein
MRGPSACSTEFAVGPQPTPVERELAHEGRVLDDAGAGWARSTHDDAEEHGAGEGKGDAVEALAV